MFGLILSTVITLMHLYLFWRAASVPLIRRHLPLTGLVAIGCSLWILFFLGRLLRHGNSGSVAVAVELWGMNWMGSLFLFVVCMLAADLLTGFGWLFSRQAPMVRGLALALGVLLSGIALVQGARAPVVKSHTIALAGLPAALDGITVAALSDLHLGSLTGSSWLQARVKQVQALKPDMVVLLGDIFEGHSRDIDSLSRVLKTLEPRLGAWAVLGNHDFYGRPLRTAELMKKSGFQLLRNRWAGVRPGLIAAGVDDLTTHYRRNNTGDPLAQALKDRPAGVTLLLSHTPWRAEQAEAAGVELMVCGHTHGGQIWPFGYLVKQVYPLFAGRYAVGDLWVIVSRGTGTWGPRMRLWQRGEILHLTLVQKQ